MLMDSLKVSPAVFTARTGWEIKPEGFCKGMQCVPIDAPMDHNDMLDVMRVAQPLGMELITDDASGISALGPESQTKVLSGIKAPELELPDHQGNPWRLKSMYGKKTLLVAWASW